MPHINIQPASRTQVYETPGQAINHIFAFRVFSKHWDYGGAPFGRTIAERRAIDAAVKARDAAAFRALPRRGYWRVELAA